MEEMNLGAIIKSHVLPTLPFVDPCVLPSPKKKVNKKYIKDLGGTIPHRTILVF